LLFSSEERENRVSGTNTRTALIGGKKERFQSYLPSELTDEEKDECLVYIN
jgi:predicted nucleotidyltransferase